MSGQQLALDLGIRTPGATVLDIEDRLIAAGWMAHRDVVLCAETAAEHAGPLMPAAYDWACSGITKGTMVPTWRCCVCGGLEVSRGQLSNNHGCHGGHPPDDDPLHGLMQRNSRRPGPPWHSPAIEVADAAP